MKTISLILLISMIHFISCSSTYKISHTKSAYDKLNKELEGERAEITLMNDTVIVGENITIGIDSSSWIESTKQNTVIKTQIIWSLPTSEIKEIAYTNNGMGAAKGAIYGVLCAGGSWAIAESVPFSRIKDNSVGKAFVTCIIMYSIIGAGIGNKDNYILQGTVAAKEDDKSIHTVKVKISSIIEEGSDYIIIEWQGKEVRLLRSEYVYTASGGVEGKIIVVPKEVYETKFRDN